MYDIKTVYILNIYAYVYWKNFITLTDMILVSTSVSCMQQLHDM